MSYKAKESALPVFTTDTMEDAEYLRILTCRHMWDGRWVMSLSEFVKSDVSTLPAVTGKLEEFYTRYKER
jgi:hypothetical protein